MPRHIAEFVTRLRGQANHDLALRASRCIPFYQGHVISEAVAPVAGGRVFQLYARQSPGSDQSIATSLPVPERVIKAVRRSEPPKQIFVVTGS